MRTRADRVELRCSTAACLNAAKMYPDDHVNFAWYTDENLFTVMALKNPQNNLLYVPVTTTKKEVAPAHSTNVQSVPYGICQHIEAGLHRPRLHRPGHKDQ